MKNTLKKNVITKECYIGDIYDNITEQNINGNINYFYPEIQIDETDIDFITQETNKLLKRHTQKIIEEKNRRIDLICNPIERQYIIAENLFIINSELESMSESGIDSKIRGNVQGNINSVFYKDPSKAENVIQLKRELTIDEKNFLIQANLLFSQMKVIRIKANDLLQSLSSYSYENLKNVDFTQDSFWI